MARRKKDSEKDVIEVKEFNVIEETEFCEEMEKSYINYAEEVILGRALPDVRDGLKPVHRRILYSMLLLKLEPENNYRKCARVVGDVLGKFHPHGDTAVYLALVLMSQSFGNSQPLVDGHGNFGSIDGDSPAGMRYTEAKLTMYAMYILNNLSKDIVDFEDNFDGSLIEPTVLPTLFPNLLINGSSGIAVGMRTEIPTHNFTEVIDSYIEFLNNPDIEIDELTKILQGPDFPTGGVIVNADKFRESFYKKGLGKIIVRCKYHFEHIERGRVNIVVTEIPFGVKKSKIIEDIANMLKNDVKNKLLNGISDIRDESNREGIRIVIEVKKGYDYEKLMSMFLHKTKLEDATSYEFLAVNAKEVPIVYNLKKYYKDVYEFQKEFYIRKYKKKLRTHLDRKEILDGLIMACEYIRTITEVLLYTRKKSKAYSRGLAKQILMDGSNGSTDYLEETDIMKKHIKIAKTFKFTDRQAETILSMSMDSLLFLDIEGYQKELGLVISDIEFCEKIINVEKELKKQIKKELRNAKSNFDTERKTILSNLGKQVYKEDEVLESYLYLVDSLNCVKIVDSIPKNFDSSEYKDYKLCKIGTNKDFIRVFTNKGKCYKVDSDTLGGLVKIKDRGKALQMCLKLEDDEEVLKYELSSVATSNNYIVLTKQGMLKMCSGSNIDSRNKSLIYTSLKKGDEVFAVEIAERDKDFDLIISGSPKFKKTIARYDIKYCEKTAYGSSQKEILARNVKLKNMKLNYLKNPRPLPEKKETEKVEEIAFVKFDENGNLILDI